ncbi:MAG: SpoIIE family protein phosphatase [Thermoguttaceae bacterium]|nr:SpoIIE family protein phosphatase [Thermoguttaceae bacterium]
MIRRFRLFPYLLTVILLCSVAVFGSIILYDFTFCRDMLIRSQEDKYTTLLSISADQISYQLQIVEEAVGENLDFFVVAAPPDDQAAIKRMELILKSLPHLFGMELLLTDAGKDRYDLHDFDAVYVWRQGESFLSKVKKNIDEERQTDWFRQLMQTKKPVWCEPYFDPVPKTDMLTFALPLLDDDGTVLAAFTGDISFDWINNSLSSLPLGNYGETVLFSKDNKFLECPNPDIEMKESLYSLVQKCDNDVVRRGYLALIEELRRQEGFYRFRRASGQYARLYHHQVERTGWSIGCVIPEREVFEIVLKMIRGETWISLAGLILTTLFAWMIARSVARPIRVLSAAADKLAEGVFETPLPPSAGHSEIAQLSYAFGKMRTDLNEHIKQKEMTARTQARINAELRLAHSIQLNMVSTDFEPLKARGIDIYAVMRPALDVGGDLYDFEMLDKEHFYFCVGDVSGKGIPASLFMVMGKTLLNSTMKALRDPAKVLEQVSAELLRGSKDGLFITALCGILNVKTGEVIYANAGHTPPIALAPGGGAQWVELLPGFPLAMMEDAAYENQTGTMAAGEQWLLYSDGATDAENAAGEGFGSKRLLRCAADSAADSCASTVNGVDQAIALFAQGAEKQTDDITLLAVCRIKQDK